MTEDKTPDLAIALEYQKGKSGAPKVVAKGRGEMAARIIEIAEEHDIVIDTNPQLAEALSGIELDETIPEELFQAVAEIIGYVLRLEKSNSWKG